MLDRLTRSLKDLLTAPIARRIPRSIHANTITLSSLPCGVASAVAAAMRLWWIGLALFVLNRLLDGLDGLVARTRGRQTELGGYLDLCVDFVTYATVPVGVAIGAYGWNAPQWPLILLLIAFYLNGASWMLLSIIIDRRAHPSQSGQTSFHMPPGIIEGSETILFFALFFLLPHYANHLFVAMATLTLLGALHRVVWGVRHLDRNPAEPRTHQ